MGRSMGRGEVLGRPHTGLMFFQAANQLGNTQIVKILTQESPQLLLDQGNAKVAQLIVLQLFATNEVRRPFFTLGIVSSIARDIGSNLGSLCWARSPRLLC